MTKELPDIKPCPFCGDTAAISSIDQATECIKCSHCEVTSKPFRHDHGGVAASITQVRRRAILDWNRRV